MSVSTAPSSSSSSSSLDDYKHQLNDILNSTDSQLLQYPIVQQLTTQTKVRPSYMAVGVLIFLTLFIFYGFGGRLVANLVGFGYPLYESFGSLKRKPAPGIVDEEDSQWLTYWVVYSTFTLVESFSDILSVWIPLYPLVKIAFLMWCMLPQTKGALLIYHAIIEPILIRYEGNIDAGHRRAKSSISIVANDLADAGGAAIEHKKRQMVDDAINSLVSSSGSGSGSANVSGGGGNGGGLNSAPPAPPLTQDQFDDEDGVDETVPGGPGFDHSKIQ